MAAGRNRFALPQADEAVAAEARRRSGPMGSAGREVGETIAAATEAQVEARRRNAADAREHRAAREAGRVLSVLALDAVRADGLPRDRLDLEGVAAAEEMEELKASIRARGQREPIEVYPDAEGRLQLKKGWRRLTALRALHAETGDPRFATVIARVAAPGEDRVALYVDMVEENAIRQDLTFAEMAAVALRAAQDPATGLSDVDEAVARLYGALRKTKRSYIRQFAALLGALGEALAWPKAVPRDIGVEAARALAGRPELLAPLCARLAAARTPAAQNAALAWAAAARPATPRAEARPAHAFRCAAVRVDARLGECRIRGERDFAAVPRDRLEAAVAAFLTALDAPA